MCPGASLGLPGISLPQCRVLGALLGISPEIMSEDIFQFTCCIITLDVAI